MLKDLIDLFLFFKVELYRILDFDIFLLILNLINIIKKFIYNCRIDI